VQQEDIVTTIASTSPHTLLEVALCPGGEGGPRMELRRLSWGTGVGWYRQQTLQIDAAEAKGLLQALRGTWRGRSPHPAGKVIPFPALAGRPKRCERRTA
jgi:hypothetical protein